ncbi:DUF3221 domain-containing protein [Metabacillus halosaccharovorans]|uniref:DUF3221 domain-containing protein n=1 Tax=Metabacillus halosaccharovorans TaxID=930124 RepID=UPI001C1FF7B7|nr:DUF3221 domain-containing protein [Metabacillus halosaccharovorans]MBU7592827.1 hypothetical protein [Metabacillus halosaccharovorans]
MKKRNSLLIIILLSSLLYACNSEYNKNEKDEVNATFIGTIEEITENKIGLVDVEGGEILSSGSRVSVKLSVNPTETFQIGDKIKVGFDGTIMESFPIQINTLTVEHVE